MANILGISIGTRNVGVAVVYQRKLMDYRIRTFPGKWTSTKCERIWDLIETLIKQNGITDIAIKVAPPSHCSENLNELVGGIKGLAGWFNIKVHRWTIQDINAVYASGEKGTKEDMVAALIEKYPGLKERWNNGKRAQIYNAKLFEAIAAAELALRAGH